MLFNGTVQYSFHPTVLLPYSSTCSSWYRYIRLKGQTRQPLKIGGDDHGTEAAAAATAKLKRHRSTQGRPRMQEG